MLECKKKSWLDISDQFGNARWIFIFLFCWIYNWQCVSMMILGPFASQVAVTSLHGLWLPGSHLTLSVNKKQIQGQEESVNNILSRIGITCTNIHWNNWHIKLYTRITTSLSLCLVLLMLTLLSGRLSLYFNTKQCNFIYATYTLFTSQNAMQLKQTYSIFCNNSNPSNKK